MVEVETQPRPEEERSSDRFEDVRSLQRLRVWVSGDVKGRVPSRAWSWSTSRRVGPRDMERCDVTHRTLPK